MDDEISKGLGGLLGVLSPNEERAEQQKARIEVGKKLGITIPDPNEKRADESDKAINESIYKVPPLNIPKIDPVDPYSKEEIKKDVMKKERENIKNKKAPYAGFSTSEIVIRETVRDEAQKRLEAMGHKPTEVKPYKAKKTGLDKNWSVDKSGIENKYKYPVRRFDALDKSTYPSDPKQRMALAHGTATDQLNQHHQDRQGKLLPKEESRKTLQYVSDSTTKWDGAPKANWLFNPVTGELEDTNDPQWLEKSENKMNQFEDNIVDPKTGQAEPKIGTDAHKEKYPERYKTGYVSKSDRIVSQLKSLKEFGKNKLNK